jgi:hypothetical protein
MGNPQVHRYLTCLRGAEGECLREKIQIFRVVDSLIRNKERPRCVFYLNEQLQP